MGDTEPGTSGIMGEPGQISASLTLRWRTGLVCPLFSETREPWGMWGRASRNGKVFLVSFAKQEKLWVEAGLPSLAHSFLQQLLIECLPYSPFSLMELNHMTGSIGSGTGSILPTTISPAPSTLPSTKQCETHTNIHCFIYLFLLIFLNRLLKHLDQFLQLS